MKKTTKNVGSRAVNGEKKRTTTLALPPFSIVGDDSTVVGKSISSSNQEFDVRFEAVAKLLEGRKNIVVLVGAGISVSCGLPDFRSKDSGIYSTLDVHELGLSCPEDLFDWDFFQEDPSPFYKFARNLYFPLGPDRKVEPSDSHKLLAMLEKTKRLLRVYSQNIDGLEAVAGVSSKKIVYAHGSLQWATCCRCQNKVAYDEILPSVQLGNVAFCRAAERSSKPKSTGLSSPTSTRSSSHRSKKRPRRFEENVCGGVLKPGVTFFGESLNDNVHRSLESDRDKVDALIVIGTSLSVAPISKVIEFLPCSIPRILINRTVVRPSTSSAAAPDRKGEDETGMDFRENYVFDAYLLGYCDDVTRALARKLFTENLHLRMSATASKKKMKKNNEKNPYNGRLLPSVLNGGDMDMTADDWKSITVPPERVLLFPGALPSNLDAAAVAYREIAHCDGCQKRIGGIIQKCVVCFDFDLCSSCFPTVSRAHHNGKHSFASEALGPNGRQLC